MVIRKLSHGGSHCYNYNHSHSINFMAITDHIYECLYADVGTSGRVNDGDVWNTFGFSKLLENQELSIPYSRCLPCGVQKIPFVLIGDDTFALKTICLWHNMLMRSSAKYIYYPTGLCNTDM